MPTRFELNKHKILENMRGRTGYSSADPRNPYPGAAAVGWRRASPGAGPVSPCLRHMCTTSVPRHKNSSSCYGTFPRLDSYGVSMACTAAGLRGCTRSRQPQGLTVLSAVQHPFLKRTHSLHFTRKGSTSSAVVSRVLGALHAPEIKSTPSIGVKSRLPQGGGVLIYPLRCTVRLVPSIGLTHLFHPSQPPSVRDLSSSNARGAE